MRLYLLGMTFFSASVFGAAYNFPILQKTLGGLDGTDGVVISKSCQINDDHSGIELKKVLELILKAEKEPVQKFLHVVRQVPSEEVWVNYPTRFAIGPATTGLRPRRIMLLKDSSSGERRSGEASDALLKIVQDSCKDL